MSVIELLRSAIPAVYTRDPKKGDGLPEVQIYGQDTTNGTARPFQNASRIADRVQSIKRWILKPANYLKYRGGYLKCQKDLDAQNANGAGDLMAKHSHEKAIDVVQINARNISVGVLAGLLLEFHLPTNLQTTSETA